MKIKQRILILNAFFIILIACAENDEYFNLGSDFLESNTNIIMIDTFRVNLSTLIIDSLPTSAIDTLIIGNYKDDVFGRISCNSYFEFGLPEAIDIHDDDIYDSVTLSMEYTGYSFGDTLLPIPFSVHLLTEELELRETNYLYNTSKFAYTETPLANCSLIPRPANSEESNVQFKLDDTFGEELFELLKDDDDLVNSESAFIQHFKGIAIVSDTTTSNSLVSFISSDATININVHYHRSNELSILDITTAFPLVNSDKQFFCINHDFSGTLLEKISNQREDIPSSVMEGKAFVQGGIGLMTKIQFPTMNDFLLFENSFILKAELFIRPAAGTYNLIDLPESIYLYHTNKNNDLGSALYNSDGSVLAPLFSYDEFYHDETYFQFDITEFIKDELSDLYFDTEHGILISLSSERYLCSFDRMVLEDASTKPELRIFFVRY